MLSSSVFHFHARIHFLSISFWFFLCYFYFSVLRSKNQKNESSFIIVCIKIAKPSQRLLFELIRFYCKKTGVQFVVDFCLYFIAKQVCRVWQKGKKSMLLVFSFWIQAIDRIARRKLRREKKWTKNKKTIEWVNKSVQGVHFNFWCDEICCISCLSIGFIRR